MVEAESIDLRVALHGLRLVSSELTVTELRRAVVRRAPVPVRRADQVLAAVALLPLDRRLLEAAGALPPPALRTLDALHLGAALGLGPRLDVLVTYDHRLRDAAAVAGLPVASPGAS